MKDLNQQLYRKALIVRASEEKIREHYPENEMKTPMHMSFGEEAIVVGVSHALRKSDLVFSSYRSHAAYLAKTEDTDGFFAELYARETSRVKGRGGSMHLCNPDCGFMGSSAIVASHIPVAVGAAYANKIQENDRIVTVFFGDGAVDEGVFWESMNIASLMQLPVMFVCEDNGLAVHTSVAVRRGYDSLIKMVDGFRCHIFESESTDPEVIYGLTCEAMAQMRHDSKPVFMELKYYRYLEHVGINHDFNEGYRSQEEFDRWYRRDPLRIQRAKLLTLGLTESEILNLETGVYQEISLSIENAKKASLSRIEDASREVFS